MTIASISPGAKEQAEQRSDSIFQQLRSLTNQVLYEQLAAAVQDIEVHEAALDQARRRQYLLFQEEQRRLWALRRCRTLADFDLESFTLDASVAPVNRLHGRDEVAWREFHRLPTKPPTRTVGDWAANLVKGENQRTVSVTWQPICGWHFLLPDGTFKCESDFLKPDPSLPYVEYEREPGKTSWVRVGEAGPPSEAPCP